MRSRSTYQVFIRGLETYAHHGVPDHEQATGHRYRIDLEMTVQGRADVTDNVADTVSYAEVAEVVLKTLHTERRRTLEYLARVISEAIFAVYPLVSGLTLTLEKPFPPAPVIAEAMGVRYTRERESEGENQNAP